MVSTDLLSSKMESQDCSKTILLNFFNKLQKHM